MKRLITIKGVLDGFRSSVSTAPKTEMEVEESLRSDHFQVCQTVRHGFPYQPTSLAYDPVQNVLCIGTKGGSLRIFGQPGVDCHCRHDGDGQSVIQIMVLVNEGALVTVCSDDTLHLWNCRQKKPEVVHSLKFQKQRITCCHLPFQSKWLYIGTERGNVHIVNIESFTLSGYVINWNKAIQLSQTAHPGQVVHLSDNPVDPNKLLIGFDSGTVVHWDLKNKTAECRFATPEALRSVSWHHEGKQFMCSHSDGSLTTWNIKATPKPVSIMMPHAKYGKEGKPDPCKPITKVEWKSVRNGEPLVIFSGGMPYDKAGRTPCITIMNGKSTTVLEMEHNIVDFVVLCETPWPNDFQEPYAIVVLLQNDLVVIDLTSIGYPCFENPYPMDIHESPVTACYYFANCPHDLIPAFYSVGSKQKRTGFSEKGWPIKGGIWKTATCSYPEIIITGHADGSLKFWDASAVTLQILYKIKTAKIFEKPKGISKGSEGMDDDPFAIQHIYLCSDSRLFCIAGATHVIFFRFSKQEVTLEVPVVEVTILYEIYDDLDSPDYDYPKPSFAVMSQHSGSIGSYSSNTSDNNTKQQESITSLKVRNEAQKWRSGFQPDFVGLLTWVDGEPPGNITHVSINSVYGLLAFGNESGLAIIDFMQKTCLVNLGTPDLYGSMDPYQRAPRSPRGKRPQVLECVSGTYFSEEIKSPTTDQQLSTHLVTGSSCSPCSRSASFNVHREPQTLYAIHETSPGTTTVKYNDNDWQSNVANEQHKRKTFSTSTTASGNADSSFENLSASDAEPSTPLSDSSSFHFDNVDNMEKTWRPGIFRRGVSHMEFSTHAKSAHAKINSHDAQHHKHDHAPMISDDAYIDSPVRKSSSNPELQGSREELSHDSSQLNPIKISLKLSRSFKHKLTLKFKKYKKSPRDQVIPDAKHEHCMPEANDTEVCIAENNNIKFLSEEQPNKVDALMREELRVHEYQGQELDNLIHDITTPVIEDPDSCSSDQVDGDDAELASSGARKLFRRVSAKMSSKFKSNRTKMTIGGSDCDDEMPEKCVNGSQSQQSNNHYLESNVKRKHLRDQLKVELIDLCDDSPKRKTCVRYMNVTQFLNEHHSNDKNDGSSFSRSRSSSMSSLENVSKEAIQCLAFADSYTRKTDNFTCPCLWVGTSLGSVLVIVLNLPPPGEQRITQPVIVSPSGTIFRLKGAILAMSFLDCLGTLIPNVSETWKDVNKEQRDSAKDDKREKDNSVCKQTLQLKTRISPSSSTEVLDRQFAVICSEKQARVISLPSQTCAYKVKITETSFVVRADVTEIKDSVCLTCYVGNGHIMVFSLPSLRPLLDTDFLPLTDYRVAKTFCISNSGHALYLCSPSEVQKLTFSAEICDNLHEMLGDLFLPCDTPEAPKAGFFKSLFAPGANSTVDREELFGESSGKASRGLARHIPGTGGIPQLQTQAGGIAGDLARTRMALTERGEKLGDLDDRSAMMMAQAENLSHTAQQIMIKYKDKKWYQF